MRCMFFAVAIFTAACGAPQGIALGSSNSAMDSEAEAEIPVCGAETATGTNINRVVCRTRSDVDSQQKAARDWRSRNGADPTRNGTHTNRDPFQRR